MGVSVGLHLLVCVYVLSSCRRLTGLEAGRLRDEQQQLTATIKDLQVCWATPVASQEQVLN